MAVTWLNGNALGDNFLTRSLGLSLDFVISSDTFLEGFSGKGLSNVFNADVDAFGDDAGVDSLVNNDTDTVFGNIEDLSCFTMIELVGKTSVNGTVSNDVNNIVLFENGEHLRQWCLAVLSVRNTKQMSCFRSETVVVRHISPKN